jgi:capsular polysaccharide transport system ATP-binding protein
LVALIKVASWLTEAGLLLLRVDFSMDSPYLFPREGFPVIEVRQASKLLPEGVSDVKKAFVNINLDIYYGQRVAFFSVNNYESRALIECLSGIAQVDRGEILHHGSVSWPVGTNQAFDKKLSGFSNAQFAAEIYSQPGCVNDDLRLIQELAGVDDETFHEPLAAWKSSARKSLELAVSLAFEFDVMVVGKIDVWNHRAVHPASVRIRNLFESRIEGRSLLIAANDQPQLAIDYCDEAIVIIDGYVCYRGDPEVCHRLVKEEC